MREYHFGSTAGLDADKMMQIFLLFAGVRWKHRYSNDTRLKAGNKGNHELQTWEKH